MNKLTIILLLILTLGCSKVPHGTVIDRAVYSHHYKNEYTGEMKKMYDFYGLQIETESGYLEVFECSKELFDKYPIGSKFPKE